MYFYYLACRGDVEKKTFILKVEKMTIDEIAQKLRESRKPISHAEVPSKCDVYGVFLKAPEDLKGFSKNPDGLIYIKWSPDLSKRVCEHHFNSEKTRTSTLRKSIGAILKEEFGLTAIPRSSGPSKTNVTNYKFLPEGEGKLTNWMTDNLEIGICSLGDYESIKKELISLLMPPLNLTGWDNPYQREIRALRKKCADEARTNR